MGTRQIKETLYFNENEIKEAILTYYNYETENYNDWTIKIDNGKTPAIIIISKDKTEELK